MNLHWALELYMWMNLLEKILCFKTISLALSSNDEPKKQLLNVECDFERIPGGGCSLRESYCARINDSRRFCVCKPNYPINVGDKLCLSQHKKLNQPCQENGECLYGSHCSFDSSKSVTKFGVCSCDPGLAYSSRQERCIRGLIGTSCNETEKCSSHQLCALGICICKPGFEFSWNTERCMPKARHNQTCETSLNCRMADALSECDRSNKRCVCGEFLSRRYVLDEVTQKCVACPPERIKNSTCSAPHHTVHYDASKLSNYGDYLESASFNRAYRPPSLTDSSSQNYIYVALSAAPFVVFAMIGAIYRLANPLYEDDTAFIENIFVEGETDPETNNNEQVNDIRNIENDNSHCVATNNTTIETNDHVGNSNSSDILCTLSIYDLASSSTDILPEPPPPYESFQRDFFLPNMPFFVTSLSVVDGNNNVNNDNGSNRSNNSTQNTPSDEPPPSYDEATQEFHI